MVYYMRQRLWAALGVFAGLSLLLIAKTPAFAQNTKETAMTLHATGPFDVKMTPQPPSEDPDRASMGRFVLEKQFHGDLEGSSKGDMLTGGTAIKNSAGYVAIERVSGSLKGRRGSFTLMHTGVMTRGEGKLIITVVPDSGTDDLVGLSGTMGIRIEPGGKHFYDFDYTLGAGE